MHIRHAAVTKFHRVFVEDLSQDVRWWETFVDNFQEFPADVGRNIVAVWRVEPDDVSVSRALFSFFWRFKVQFNLVATFCQSFLVWLHSFIKRFFVR